MLAALLFASGSMVGSEDCRCSSRRIWAVMDLSGGGTADRNLLP
jgi:hypothetical protein